MKMNNMKNFYVFTQLSRKPYSYIDMLEHTDLFREMLNYTAVQCKDKMNATINFCFESEVKFSVESKSSCISFSIDISKVKITVFEQLLFGLISCYDFLMFHALNQNIIMDISDEDIIIFMDTWDHFVERIGYKEENFFFSDDSEIARKVIQKEHVLWCFNKSCSGKTFLGINTLNYFNQQKFVFNPAINGKLNRQLMLTFLKFGCSCSLLFDDLQCDVDYAIEIFNFITENQSDLKKRNLYVFITSWYSLSNSTEFSHYKNSVACLETKPEKFVMLMKRRILFPKLNEICNDNLSLINAALSVQKTCKRNQMLDFEQIKQLMFENFVKVNATNEFNLIYILAVLGTYEFATPLAFLNHFGEFNINSVKTAKIINDSIFFAHRSICSFISNYIENMNNVDILPRKVIIKRYINFIESTEKWKAIRHIIGENEINDVLTVSPIWNLMNSFQESLKQQTLCDPSWGNTLSSMYFVLSSAQMLGVVDEYHNVVNELIKSYFVENNEILIDYKNIRTTYDFIKIKEKMIEEDSICCNFNYERGEDIDLMPMHKNWLLGLLVGLKDTLVLCGNTTLYPTVESILFNVQDVNGWWYPKRVPWITARILIGLSEAGYTAENESIKKAINYLLSQIEHQDYWEAHTGGWNNQYETTSLCLEALIKCGYNCEKDSRIVRVISYLKSCSESWMSENFEIDGTTTACAIMKIDGIQSDLLEYINKLADRNIHRVIEETTCLDFNTTQSCKSTQIAYYALELCWYILEKDLPNLLDDFILRAEQVSGEVAMKKQIFISYSEDSPQHIKRIKKISDYLKSEGFIVYFYADEPLGTNNIVFMQKISICDAILIIGTEKYFAKATEIKQGGVFFEENIMSFEFMNSNYEKMIPISFDDFGSSFPAPFGINKGIRVKRIDTNFLSTLSMKLKNKLF